MNAVIPLTRTAAPKLWQYEKAAERFEALRPLIAAIDIGLPKTPALAYWARLTGNSVATGRRWLQAFESGGINALAPKPLRRSAED